MRFLLVTFLILFGGGSDAILDIKGFLGDKPLTFKRIVEDVLEYFQQEDPRGIPVLKIPNTIRIEQEIETTNMKLENISISGHSGISLEYVDVNLDLLQAQVRLNIPRLEILSLYEWPSFWSTSKGDMNVTFVNLDIWSKFDFGVTEEGRLEVVSMEPIFSQEMFVPTMSGLTTQHSLMVFAADTFFDSFVLPLLQNSIRGKGMTSINARLKERLKDRVFPVDISPVDFAVAKVRSDIVRERNLDPLRKDSHEINYLAFSLVLKNIELRGLSSLHRSDVIRTEFSDNRFYVTIEIGTQGLHGSTDWSLYSSLFPLGSGHAGIIIERIRISLEAQQEADVRHPPILRRIDIEIGNFALRSPGDSTLDYFLEAAVNIVPNALRSAIIDKRVEGMLKKKIQDQFNSINLEHIIQDYLDKSDVMEKSIPLSF